MVALPKPDAEVKVAFSAKREEVPASSVTAAVCADSDVGVKMFEVVSEAAIPVLLC